MLAGRDPERLRPIAARLTLEARAAPLDDPDRLRAALSGIAVVIHAAGPFSKTAKPMADACLAAGAHYVDITGEISVLEALAAQDAAAKAAGIVLLPAAGFDVVPSDCLAAHVAGRLPGATHLRISIGGFGGFSRGTARTMVEGIAWGTRVRRDGRIVELPSPLGAPLISAAARDAPSASAGATCRARGTRRESPTSTSISRPFPPWRRPRACPPASAGSSQAKPSSA
ncbi:saccharopine dehydrogenase NADP-binding domain-containing protein [Methylobacterium phyllosphaerae]